MFPSESALHVIFHVLCELSCDPVLALILAPPEPWVCWHLTLVSLRCCFHQVTTRDPLKLYPRYTFIVELNPLRCYGGNVDCDLAQMPHLCAYKVYTC